jgi:uncharacterized membrane protein YhaH (DUF805 family)
MIETHRGAGMLVPLFGILSALLMNIVTIKLFDHSYYQEHSWPKLAVLLLAGVACLVTGLLLKRKRLRDAVKERAYIDSLKTGDLRDLAFSGPRDHLMFIPLQYWSLIYFAAGILYAIKSS